MGKRKFGALDKLEADLYVFLHPYELVVRLMNGFRPSLQCQIRRDPLYIIKSLRLLYLTSHSSYQKDFINQYGMYENDREVLLQAPSAAIHTGIISFRELVDFIAHVADCYPSLTKNFPEDLVELLSRHHKDLEVELRSKIVGSLALLKRKGIIDSSKSVRKLHQRLIKV